MLVAGLMLAALIPLVVVLAPRRSEVASGRRRGGGRLAAAVASALALFGTSAVAAQQDEAGGAPSASSADAVVQASEVTVLGRVTDGSGNGIRDVRIELRSTTHYVSWVGTGAWPESSTDSDGNYVLGFALDDVGVFQDAVLSRSLVVAVTPSDDRYYGLQAVPLEIRTGGPTRLDIQIGLAGRISGRVVDPDGMPVHPHLIWLHPDPQSANIGSSSRSGPTDESGNFEIGGIAAGRYVLDRNDRSSSSPPEYLTVQEGSHQQLGEIEVLPYSYQFEGQFLDDEGSVHESAIDAVANRGLLRGTTCNRGRICPKAGITRAVMAVWLGRALVSIEPQAIEASRFSDVDVDGAHAFEAAHIDRFADLGVTRACATSPLRYCPDQVVTRAEMATFLQRAFDLAIPDESAGFVDVDSGNVHARAIDALRASGTTVGCDSTGPRYCPDRQVTRGEMATFIHRSFELLDTRADARKFESAQALEAGSRVSAELEAGETDLYRIFVVYRRDIEVETHGELDLYATLKRVVTGAPHEKIAEDDDGGVELNSRISHPSPHPGWYLIEIRGYGSTEAGDYELSVTFG